MLINATPFGKLAQSQRILWVIQNHVNVSRKSDLPVDRYFDATGVYQRVRGATHSINSLVYPTRPDYKGDLC